MSDEWYAEALAGRRDLAVPEKYADRFCTLSAAGWDGPWVSPMQESSRDPCGPVVMGTHWLDAETADARRGDVEWYGGYLPDVTFNRVLDLALWRARLHRRDVYVTQACHLLPLRERRGTVPVGLWRESYEAVTRYEVRGRPVLALGGVAQRLCEHYGLRYLPFRHPGTSGPTQRRQAEALAAGLEWAAGLSPPSRR